jgi:hypothetical protein
MIPKDLNNDYGDRRHKGKATINWRHKMKTWIFWGTALCVLVMTIIGAAQSAEKPVFISLIVDMNVPEAASEDQIVAAKEDLVNLFNIFNERGINWTLVLTNDASDQARLLLAQLTSVADIEVAISGNHSNEMLSSKSYSEQVAILKRSKLYGESCDICAAKEHQVIVKGFMPQSFDQNEDTYKALDSLGFKYNAGFQAGILYAPGHENDVWPYEVEKHKFYAVPVSTYMFSGELIPLDDRYAANKGISSSQWEDMLAKKFDEISGKDEPMVISLSSSTSGSGEYLEALKQFLNYTVSANSKFVVTSDLVDMSRTGNHDFPPSRTAETAQETTSSTTSTVSIESNKSTVCLECDAVKVATSINTTG